MVLTAEKLADLIARILEASEPRRIVLFGSAAKGSGEFANDVDVLVVVDDAQHCRRVEQAIYAKLLGFGLPVDVVAVTESNLRKYGNSPGLIYREALATGRELYAA